MIQDFCTKRLQNYLIQRCALDKSFVLDAKTSLSDLWFEYMGAAEFKWNSIPESIACYCGAIKAGLELVIIEVTTNVKPYSFRVRQDEMIGERTFYVICPKGLEDEAREWFKTEEKGKSHLHEELLLHSPRYTVWFSLMSPFAFARDKEIMENWTSIMKNSLDLCNDKAHDVTERLLLREK